MTKQYQAVIFDLDGTLIDSSPSILKCFGQVLNEARLQPLVPLTDSLVGPPLRQTLVKLVGSADNVLLDRLVDSFKACYDTVGYKATDVYAGVDAMLAHLSEVGIPLAIATNKRRIPTLKIIEYLGWVKYFQMVGTLDTPDRPHANKAALIRFILNEMWVSSDRALYVGDKGEDGEAAEANGMAFCAAGWGYGVWDAAKTPSGWQIAQSVHELVEKFFVFNLM
ncbi:MAG: HAD family hydrolase [Desulfuromonadales bacterium]